MQDGVMLRSDLGAFRLDGPDVSLFMTKLLPLLDGGRDRSAVATALAPYSQASVLGFLALLERHGLLEEVTDPGASDAERWSGQDAFFRKWSE
ncbi:MAG TPA: molybdopterin biosynthesis protein, partial [Chloroflexota bacterium]|nr:molybdopterin biosynthesis protein [Chloroflexota bacterium]